MWTEELLRELGTEELETMVKADGDEFCRAELMRRAGTRSYTIKEGNLILRERTVEEQVRLATEAIQTASDSLVGELSYHLMQIDDLVLQGKLDEMKCQLSKMPEHILKELVGIGSIVQAELAKRTGMLVDYNIMKTEGNEVVIAIQPKVPLNYVKINLQVANPGPNANNDEMDLSDVLKEYRQHVTNTQASPIWHLNKKDVN